MFSRVFAWAAQRGHVEADTAAFLVGAVKGVKEADYAALTSAEDVATRMRAVCAYHGEPQVRAGLQTLAHNFLRPGEVRTLQRSDVDLDAALVTISGERIKMGRDHVVPLSRQVAAVPRSRLVVSVFTTSFPRRTKGCSAGAFLGYSAVRFWLVICAVCGVCGRHPIGHIRSQCRQRDDPRSIAKAEDE